MTTLTITVTGEVTLKKDMLSCLGVEPGQKIKVSELPGGRIEISAARPTGSIEGFIGLLANQSRKVATIEEMNEAAANGWADKV